MKRKQGKKLRHKLRDKELTCPCCQTRTEKVSKILNQTYKIWSKYFEMNRTYLLNYNANVTTFDDYSFQWACSHCIKSGKAQAANTELYSEWQPCLAYFDQTRYCKSCEDFFTFAKEEQKFLFEKLQFSVRAKPNTCLPCRRKNRERNKLNTELSNLLKEPQKLNQQDFLRVSEIYKELDKPEKQKHFLKLSGQTKRPI